MSFELNHTAGSDIAFDRFRSKSPENAQFWPQSRHFGHFGIYFLFFAYFGLYPIATAGFLAAVWPIWDPRALRSHLGLFLENSIIWGSELDRDQILHLAIFSHQIS